MVVGESDRTREPFDRNKLRRAIETSKKRSLRPPRFRPW